MDISFVHGSLWSCSFSPVLSSSCSNHGATPASSSSSGSYQAGSQYSDGRDSGSVGGVGMSGDSDVGFGSGTDCLTENMKVKLNGVIDFVTNIKVGDMIDGSVVK